MKKDMDREIQDRVKLFTEIHTVIVPVGGVTFFFFFFEHFPSWASEKEHFEIFSPLQGNQLAWRSL